MKKSKNFELLAQDIRRPFEVFVADMLKIHSGRLQSIAVYGSAAGKDFRPGRSDVNSIFIFDQVDMTVLEASHAPVKRASRHRISAPLFLTRHYIEASLDVFPLEFLEMKENHVQIYGDDVLASLDVRTSHLRLFCEQQIKGKLIRIRQAVLELGRDEKALIALLEEALGSLFPVFRGLLRLRGKVPPSGKEDVLVQVAEVYDVSMSMFLAAYRELYARRRPGIAVINGWLGGIIDEIRKLAVKIDQL